jgi:hypothetical protein
MPLRRRSAADLGRELTGLVVESLAVGQDVDRRTVRCAACARRGDDPELGVGDIAVVVLREYEGFTWEIQDVSCNEHGVDSVADAVGVGADDQAVVSSVLEAAGYHSPDGTYYPEALTLGDVAVIDYSPAEEGYAGSTAPREGVDGAPPDPTADADDGES